MHSSMGTVIRTAAAVAMAIRTEVADTDIPMAAVDIITMPTATVTTTTMDIRTGIR